MGDKNILFLIMRFKESVVIRLGLLTHLSQMNLPILIHRTSQFQILGGSGGNFNFYSNFIRIFCKQTVETRDQTSDLGLHCLPIPIKTTLGLYGLMSIQESDSLCGVGSDRHVYERKE